MKQILEIVDVLSREILDSRGNPTVEVEPGCSALRRLHRHLRGL